MAGYVNITTTRTTLPDHVEVLSAIKTATGDATATLVQSTPGQWRGKKATEWSQAHKDAAQTIVDTTAALTPQQIAQREIDAWPIMYRALVLALVDEINILRTHAAIGLAPRTPAQALAGIRQKAGNL